jgi:hypothetical protein
VRPPDVDYGNDGMYDYGYPEYPPDVTVPLEISLVPLMLHQPLADAGTRQAAAGEKYQQPCYQVDNPQDKKNF